MPIRDYEARAQWAEDRLMRNEKIPLETKRVIQRFLTAYDVSAARRQIFLDKIVPLLEFFPNIEDSLTDRDGINQYFARLRRRYSPATYATYINVTRRFLSWLNQGEQPVSLCDLKNRRSGQTRRNLKPEDMTRWEEGEQIAAASCSIQMAAICLVQLDCGFRPSEFVDLNYGDVDVQTNLAVFNVRGGKTGSRSVVAQRCVPSLLKWLDAHPSKRLEDPLWVFEDSIKVNGINGTRVRRYNYDAMKKRLKLTGKRIGITKPLDFYSLRHSSCVLDKLDNLPVDMAADRHGHSVKHFVGTYGRLSVQDVMRRFHAHYGQEDEEAPKPEANPTCPHCNTVNTKQSKWCVKCGTRIDPSDTLKDQQLPVPATDEVIRLKNELAAAKTRELGFQKQQMELLKQMKDIRSAINIR